MTASTRERIGDWFQTYTGRQFWPFDPRPEDVCIDDIAHALSRICRFGGHVTDWYSVAQHSVLVSLLVPSDLALRGLLHDAEEAYTGDMVRPLKRGLRVHTEAWDAMADGVTRVIAQAYNLRILLPAELAEIHRADNVALSTERRDLLRATGRVWRTDAEFPPMPERIAALERDDAEDLFLERFRFLSGRAA
jgi:5'-deoxynucleotidase YfbR-like HD superfamily hydrolase